MWSGAHSPLERSIPTRSIGTVVVPIRREPLAGTRSSHVANPTLERARGSRPPQTAQGTRRLSSRSLPAIKLSKERALRQQLARASSCITLVNTLKRQGPRLARAPTVPPALPAPAPTAEPPRRSKLRAILLHDGGEVHADPEWKRETLHAKVERLRDGNPRLTLHPRPSFGSGRPHPNARPNPRPMILTPQRSP